MPIDYINKKEYRINYEAMKEELMQTRFLHNPQVQETYIENWIDFLKACDKEAVTSFSDPYEQILLAKEQLDAPEIFQAQINYKSNIAFIHFRVSRILQVLELNGIDDSYADIIEISEFTSDQQIQWTQPNSSSHFNCLNPILMVPFTIAHYKELVIDGNHRIAKAIQDNAKGVKAISLSPEALVEGNLFVSRFDKFLYIFQNEVVWIGSQFNSLSHDDDMIRASYFESGSVNVC